MSERACIKSRPWNKGSVTFDCRLWNTSLGKTLDFDLVISTFRKARFCHEMLDIHFPVRQLLPLAEMIIRANLYRRNKRDRKKLLPIAKMIAEANDAAIR